MVIVIGRAVARPDTFDALLALSLEHVHRSRLEPGCLSHDVHREVEDPLAVTFVERWADRAALQAHFEVPASLAFATALAELTSEPPTMDLYRTTD